MTDPLTDKKSILYAIETTADSDTKGALGIACNKGKILKALLQMPGNSFQLSSESFGSYTTTIFIRIGEEAPSGSFHPQYSIPNDHTAAIMDNHEIRRALKAGRVRFRAYDAFNSVHDLNFVTANLPSSFQADCGK